MSSMTNAPVFRGPLAAAFGDVAPARLRTLLVAPDSALPVAPATDRAVWGAVDAAALTGLFARAAAERGSPWPQPLASLAARVHRDGDRTAWESLAFARQHRLSRAAVAAATTLDDSWIDDGWIDDGWIDEVADGVQLLCEQSSWCWPAHDDTHARHGAMLATVTDPYLDLGAGEAVGQLAWIDHLLGAPLDERYPGLRERMRHEARVRVFDPFVRRRDWHWIGLDGDVHNWNPWIHGNVLAAALRLLDEPGDADDRALIVSLAIEGLDRYVAALPGDGAVDEGYAYWWNGACRALEALDLLAHATSGALDATEVPALRATVAFPHRMHLGREWFLNLADGRARPVAEQPWHALHRAAMSMGDDRARRFAASHRHPGTPLAHESDGLGRLLRALTDPEWIAAENATAPLPRDTWLPSVQVLVARERGGTAAGLTLAAKGGHNGEHHNHNDVGSFVVACDGVPVLVDAGRPTYTAETFGPGRYDIWTMQSSWHNLPEIAGVPQREGAEHAARDVECEMGDAASSLRLDLAGAYEVEGLRSWRREVRLDRAQRRVVIADAWDLDADGAGTDAPTTVHLLVAGEVTVHAGGAGVVPLEGATPVRVSWPIDVTATATVRELDDPMLSEVWGPRLTRLDLDVASRREVVVTVELDQTIREDDR